MSADSNPIEALYKMQRGLPYAAAFGIAVAGAAFLGWLSGMPSLSSIVPDWEPMKANTALGLIAAFAAFWLRLPAQQSPWRQLLSVALALFLVILGAATLVEYVFDTDLGIDQLLVSDPTIGEVRPPGRMAPGSAVNFVLLGAALLLLPADSNRRTTLAQWLLFAVFFVALGALLGGILTSGTMTWIGTYEPMAVPTALLFILLSLAILVWSGDSGFMLHVTSEHVGGVFARRFVPIVLIVMPLMGWIRIKAGGIYSLTPEGSISALAMLLTIVLTVMAVAVAASLNRVGRSRRVALRELQATEQRFRDLVEGSIQGILIHRRGKPLFCNQAYARMYGYDSPEELLARGNLDNLLAPGNRDRILAYEEARREGGDVPSIFEVEALRKDGSPFWALRMVRLVEWEGEVAAQMTQVDVTESKKAEAELRQAQKMEAVGQLTGGVAHDFNNLLAVVVGSLDLLDAESGEKPAARVALITRAREAAQRGAALTQRLLAFSRRQMLQPAVLDVREVVGSMNELLLRSLGETIAVETVFPATLWRTRADKSQFESALLNLAINARDAMPVGGKLTIEGANIYLDKHYEETNLEVKAGDYVMVAVTDTGTGMKPEVAARAFEPFFTTKETGKGSGLGLSMVFGFAKQSGGHVKIYSEVGHGTTVRFYLPREREHKAVKPGSPVASPPRSQQAAKVPRGNGEVVLVAEDDPHVRKTVIQILNLFGYKVVAATDGPSALEELDRGTKIDLLFTDVVMPGGMSGFQLAEEAQRRRPGLKVLFTTGYTQGSMQHQGKLGVDADVVTKPYDAEDLARSVARVLAAPASMPTVQAPSATAGRSAAAPFAETILVIDDDDLLRTMVRGVLGLAGYSVLDAASAQAGLKIFREQRPRLVITDIRMPDMDGLDAAREMRRSNPDVRLIFMSGSGRDETAAYMRKFREFGHAVSLSKPFQPRELLRQVQDVFADI